MGNRKTAVLLVSVVLIWGINWTVTKIIVSAIPPIWATALRATIAVSALFLFQCITRTLIVPKMRDLPVLCVVAVFHMVLFSVFMAAGLQYISVGRSIVLGYTTPLWVGPAAWLFLREAMPARKIAGIVIGLLGLVVLMNPLTPDWGNSRALTGSGLLLLSALSWAVSILCVRAFTWYSTPFQLSPWQNLLAATLMIPLAFFWEGPLDFAPTPALIAALAYSGLIATAYGFWAMNVVNRHFTATTTSLALLATPVAGIASSLVMLGEAVDLPLIVAGSMILGGIALGAVNVKRPPPRAV